MFVDDDAGRYRQAGFGRQFDIRQDADPDHHEIGRHMPAIAEADAGDIAAVAFDARDLHAEMNANAGRGVARLEEFGDFRGHRARHHAGAEFDHVDFQALAPGGRGEFQSDEAGADHDDALAGSDPVPQRLAFVEGAQIAHALQIGVGNVEQAIARAGRQHQMTVVEEGTGAEQQFMRPRSIDTARSEIRSIFWSEKNFSGRNIRLSGPPVPFR